MKYILSESFPKYSYLANKRQLIQFDDKDVFIGNTFVR